MRLPLREALRVLLLGALAALSLPGVHAARAETDLVPPAKQLFSLKSPQPARPSRSSTCGASPAAVMQRADTGRQAAMARLAQVMGAGPAGDGEALDGRGYGYPTQRDPGAEMMRIQQEAQRLHAARAAH
jgi:hypothetical protein